METGSHGSDLRRIYRKTARVFPALFDIVSLWRTYAQPSRLRCYCVCCDSEQRFRLFGMPPRLNALCPNCGSLERHRLILGYFKANEKLVTGSSVLHFAAEGALESYLKHTALRYLPVDYSPRPGHMKQNIESLTLPDQEYDLILCSHVLEHVDDSKALAELYRVLKPGGIALLLFPISEGMEKTYEDGSIVSDAERVRHFGQYDHVRIFGADARDRIKNAGFTLTEHTATMPEALLQGLQMGEKIFIAQRPKAESGK